MVRLHQEAAAAPEAADETPAAPAAEEAKPVSFYLSLSVSQLVLIHVVKAEEAPKKEEHPKSPSLLAKLLAPFKSIEKKVKPKKLEKKEEAVG